MKISALNLVVAVLCIALATACSKPSYLGKTYAPTQQVDVYLDPADVRKSHTTMGTTTYDQNFQSLDAMQQKIIEVGKAKGADGVIMKLSEEVAFTQQTGGGTISKNKKNNNINTSSNNTTFNSKKKKITATYIKYE